MRKTQAIVLCTPSLGAVSIWWARQVAQVMWPLNMGRHVLFVRDDAGNEIAECRNNIVQRCLMLESDTHEIHSLFWVDDDVLVPMTALLKLYDHHVPIVSGCYFTKSPVPEPLIFPDRMHGVAEFIPDQVTEAWGVPMGLTLVKMEVYKKLLEAGLPKDKYGRPEWYKTNRQYKLEGNMIDCGGTEDLYFCELAHNAGYQPIVDTSKHTFGYHFDKGSQRGFPAEQFKQWERAQPVTWKTKNGLVTWE